MAMSASVFCVLIIQVLVLINNAVSDDEDISPLYPDGYPLPPFPDPLDQPSTDSSCRPGWELFNGACYGYSQAKVSFADAVAICNAQQSIVVEIESSEENTFVKQLAGKKQGEYVWIGGSDMFQEGNWQWFLSGNQFTAFNDWGSGEPNDWAGAEECVVLRKADSYKWNDVTCTDRLNFICEQKIEVQAE